MRARGSAYQEGPEREGEEMIDYRALLKSYMRHVQWCEGPDYIVDHLREGRFTDEEWAALNALSRENGNDPDTINRLVAESS